LLFLAILLFFAAVLPPFGPFYLFFGFFFLFFWFSLLAASPLSVANAAFAFKKIDLGILVVFKYIIVSKTSA